RGPRCQDCVAACAAECAVTRHRLCHTGGRADHHLRCWTQFSGAWRPAADRRVGVDAIPGTRLTERRAARGEFAWRGDSAGVAGAEFVWGWAAGCPGSPQYGWVLGEADWRVETAQGGQEAEGDDVWLGAGQHLK